MGWGSGFLEGDSVKVPREEVKMGRDSGGRRAPGRGQGLRGLSGGDLETWAMEGGVVTFHGQEKARFCSFQMSLRRCTTRSSGG